MKIKHNPIDLDTENDIDEKPYYKFVQQYKIQTFVQSLQLYFDRSTDDLNGQFNGTYEIYKAIYDSFWSNYYRDTP